MKEYLRKEEGITLIALIITIIILVILAAVSIRAVYNMGIVGHAINGTQDYARAAKEENRMLDRTGSYIDEALEKLREIQGNGVESSGTIEFEANVEVEENDTNSRVLHIALNSDEATELSAEDLLPIVAIADGIPPESAKEIYEEWAAGAAMHGIEHGDTWQKQVLNSAEYYGIPTSSLQVTSLTFAYDDGTLTIDSLSGENNSFLVRINGEYTINVKDIKTNKTGSIKYTMPANKQIPQEETFTSKKTVNTNYPEGSTNSNRIAVIPNGFAVIKKENNETYTAGEGIVITDNVIKYNNQYYSVGNEYVWIPVNNEGTYPMTTEVSVGLYRGILYDLRNWSGTGTVSQMTYSSSSSDSYDYNVSGHITYNKEPGTISYDYGIDLNGQNLETPVNTIGITQTVLQDEYNAMAQSVDSYGGFYVARYELSYNNGGQSQRGKRVASSASESTGQWYWLYDACRNTCSTDYVQSMMITGAQYDQIMLWMIENGQGSYVQNSTGKGNYSWPEKASGRLGSYKVMNIYDLAGNLMEWTSEAGGSATNFDPGLHYRCARGGSFLNPYWYAAIRIGYHSDGNYTATSRPTLYIR